MAESRSKSEPASFVTGGDWSVGLNSTTSLDQLVMMNMLGRGLRREYQTLIDAPLPDAFKVLVERLDTGDEGHTGTRGAPR